MSVIRKIIKHPLFILIAGFLLTSYSVGVRQLLTWIGGILSYEIPLWVFIAIAALVLLVISVVTKIRSREPQSSIPKYCSYTSEELHGVLWKWKWIREHNSDLPYVVSDNDICEYCPNCHMVLEDTEDYFHGAVNYICDSDSCDWAWSTALKPFKQGAYGRKSAMSRQELRAKVTKEIERRVRTGAWRTNEKINASA